MYTTTCPNTSLRLAPVRTGAVFMAYAREKSVTHATLFLLHLHRHFQEYGISLSGSVIQTDNGTEFTAPWNSRKVTAFTQVVEKCLGATHHLIPPGAKTYQSDVESFHRLVEEYLYAAEPFGSEKESLRKAVLYQASFNCTRKNSYKGDTPLNLVRETYPGLPLEALVFIPVILDNLLVPYKDELAQLAKVGTGSTMCLHFPGKSSVLDKPASRRSSGGYRA